MFLLCPNTCQAPNHHHWCGSMPGVFSSPYHMPNTKRHAHWCRFMVSIFLPLTTCQAQNHTLVGVSSLSDPFLAPRMNFEGCSLIFYIYLIQYIKSLWEYCGNPVPVYTGREFGGYGCGSAKDTPWDTHCYDWFHLSLLSHVYLFLSSSFPFYSTMDTRTIRVDYYSY